MLKQEGNPVMPDFDPAPEELATWYTDAGTIW